ncbi:MAG: DUF2279 domain-containing protein [Acidovorax sp.]|uniref:DUF2279 domain-containing protein n=1 Tax=Acidovorax sp. TaxID=1872122 RepID=UPI0039E288B4
MKSAVVFILLAAGAFSGQKMAHAQVGPANGTESVGSGLSGNTPYFPERVPREGDFSFLENASRAKYETAALLAGITLLGAKSWNWGSSHSFKFNSEGWFGRGTGSGGADKLGHAFSSYSISNLLTDAMYFRGGSREDAALAAAMISFGLMSYVELFDGYSVDHGFSKEDMVMNLSGIGLSYLRSVVPGLRDKLDFRLEYQKSSNSDFRPLSDYMGQRYVFSLKLSGFDAFRTGPLRYVELQGGYYARGFKSADRSQRERTTFLGVGVNLGELIFGGRPASRDLYSMDHLGRAFLEHVQLPYTSYRAIESHHR